MKTLTPSALKICMAAMGHFADSGYAAASLSKIAATAGIRKASIYAHFSGKDELFMESYKIALHEESAFLGKSFEKDKSAGMLPGYAYCKAAKKRYGQSASFRFLLAGAYFQPPTLKVFLDKHYWAYQKEIGELFKGHMKRQSGASKSMSRDIEVFAQAYLGIADSLHVELVYTGGKLFDKRFSAMWRMFSDSIGSAGFENF